MRKSKIETWVVYRNNDKKLPSNAICSQSEWEELERQDPGVHTLIQSGIQSEGEAEKLARGKSGDPVPRGSRAPK